MAEDKRNAFELTLDDNEAIMDEIEYRIHQDAEYFAMDVNGADFLPEELQNLIDIGKFEEFHKRILDNPALIESVKNYYYTYISDFLDTLEIVHETNNAMLNEELHHLLKTPMTEKYHIDGITNFDENPEFIMIGKGVGWQGTAVSDKLLLNMDKMPETQLLESFSLNGDSRLVLKQEDENVPALEIMRYSHDEPTGASFLVVPYDAAKEVLELPKFADWRKMLEAADKHFETMKMPDLRLLPDLSEHTERLEKISAYNQKIEARDIQISQPAKEYLLHLTDDFQGYHADRTLRTFIRLNVFDMESEDNPPEYEYYADAALAKLEEEKGKGCVTKDDVRNLQKEVMRILPVPIEESTYIIRGFEDAAPKYLVPPLKQQVEDGIGKMVDDLKKQGFALPAIGKALQSASKEATEKLERESSAART